MKKLKKIMKEAIDSLTYKRAYYYTFCNCKKCSPHKGCNRRRIKDQRSWKKFRNTKYKIKMGD